MNGTVLQVSASDTVRCVGETNHLKAKNCLSLSAESHVPFEEAKMRRQFGATLFLASDEAKFMTGQVVAANGGFYMSQ